VESGTDDLGGHVDLWRLCACERPDRGRGVVARGEGRTVGYFTNVGPKSGPLLYRKALGLIGVHEARGSPETIGFALCTGQDAERRAVFRLTLGMERADLPGRWVVVAREFCQIED
jgi:hypothetical protein